DGIRELEEEVGLSVNPVDLTSVGVHRIVDHRDGITNREQVHVFFVRSDLALDRFTPDPAEVSSLVEVGIGALLTLVDPANDTTRVDVREWAPGSTVSETTIGPDDLMPGYTGYLIKTLIMAERFAAGRSPIAI
ncbi:MAG: hypothetical protein OEW83_12430, partial [Acidimicrobiia bacterium]|nr:hypothetical protein [Acidimicrobiia bacterium]